MVKVLINNHSLQSDYGRKKATVGAIASGNDYLTNRLEIGEDGLDWGMACKIVGGKIMLPTKDQENHGVIIFDYTQREGVYGVGEFAQVMTYGDIYVNTADTSKLALKSPMAFDPTTKLWVAQPFAQGMVVKFSVDSIVDEKIVKLHIHDVVGSEQQPLVAKPPTG